MMYKDNRIRGKMQIYTIYYLSDTIVLLLRYICITHVIQSYYSSDTMHRCETIRPIGIGNKARI